MPSDNVCHSMMGPRAVTKMLSRSVTHEYAPGMYGIGSLFATVLYFETMSEWTFFDMEFEEFAIAAILLIAYFLFICSVWVRAWYLDLPNREPKFGHMSLSGGVVLAGYGLILFGATPTTVELAWVGVGVALVGLVLLAREVACWLDQTTFS